MRRSLRSLYDFLGEAQGLFKFASLTDCFSERRRDTGLVLFLAEVQIRGGHRGQESAGTVKWLNPIEP